MINAGMIYRKRCRQGCILVLGCLNETHPQISFSAALDIYSNSMTKRPKWTEEQYFYIKYVTLHLPNERSIKKGFQNGHITIENYTYFSDDLYVKTINLDKYKVELLKLQMMGKIKDMADPFSYRGQIKEYCYQYLADCFSKLEKIQIGQCCSNLNGSYQYLGIDELGDIGLLDEDGYIMTLAYEPFIYDYTPLSYFDKVPETHSFFDLDTLKKRLKIAI